MVIVRWGCKPSTNERALEFANALNARRYGSNLKTATAISAT